MRYRLVPGLLSERNIECDDTHHKLVVNLHLVPLSVTQYKLVAALLRQRQRWEKDTEDQVPLILTVQRLQQVAGLTRRKDVKKYLCYASARLESQELRIACIHGYGYAIFHVAELEGEALDGAPPRPASATSSRFP